ncbi:MAG: hypothetical protein R2880_04595 [Deinococcales bacterium]
MRNFGAKLFLGICLLGVAWALAQRGQGVVLEPYFLPDPIVLSYKSGGAIRASDIFGTDCEGFISQSPDHIIDLRQPFDFLQLRVESKSDTTLVVVHESSQKLWCNDDDGESFNPQLRFEGLSAGRYAVYVGSFKREAQGDYQLFISEFHSDARDFRQVSEGEDRRVIIGDDFSPDPLMMNFFAGGPTVGSERFGNDCRGYIGEKPDHILELKDSFSHLYLYVKSQADTSLIVINSEGQSFCSDNTGNSLNPALNFTSLKAGSYQIYVGNFDASEQPAYQLFISQKTP